MDPESVSPTGLHDFHHSLFVPQWVSSALAASHLLPQPAARSHHDAEEELVPLHGSYLHSSYLVRTAFRWERTVVPKVNSTDEATTLSVEVSS